jgi:uncharacterized membrane protein YczE
MRVLGNSDRRLVRRTVQLFVGLALYGVSMALMIESGLGLTSWDVFHQGLSQVTGLSFGLVVILAGIPILLLWIPLRQRPGFGTIANIVVIGLVVDATLPMLPSLTGWPARVGFLIGGVLLNGLATGLYIGARMGPGPRDGLMTGLHGRLPRVSIRVIRTAIEVVVLGAGFLLGGTVGIGTLVYALSIGPLAQLFLALFTIRPAAEPTPAPAT